MLILASVGDLSGGNVHTLMKRSSVCMLVPDLSMRNRRSRIEECAPVNVGKCWKFVFEQMMSWVLDLLHTNSPY